MEEGRGETYQVGKAKITRVLETSLAAMPPTALFPGWHESILDDECRSLALGRREDRRETVLLSVHSWVIELGDQVILIDTGVGNDKPRPFSRMFDQLHTPYLERLKAVGVRPEQVDAVLLTHLHTDHVGWNTRLADGRWVPTFPNARYVFAEPEVSFFATPLGIGRRMVFEDSVEPIIESGQSVLIGPKGGDCFGAFTFHPTPGHSVGHMAISLRSDGAEAIFSGDIFHNPVQIHHPDWSSAFCAEPELSRLSRRWLLDHAATRNATVFTAHCSETSAGIIRRRNGNYEWEYR